MKVYCKHQGRHAVSRGGVHLVFVNGVAEVPDAVATSLITIRGYSDKEIPVEEVKATTPAAPPPPPPAPVISMEEPEIAEVVDPEPEVAPAPAPREKSEKKVRGRPPKISVKGT